ncbi:MAG: hydantoinase/oxoprolinase family protein, partial [Firmicutes bacterium]|nr:hydantoinase/oxoprolinase family protein [Bacillota bacterium]
GGTFTDFWAVQGEDVRRHKVLSTPQEPEQAILQGLSELGIVADSLIIHGSTVATNAFLERKGARVALVTTAGFEDVLEIGRQNRIGVYDLKTHKADVLVPEAGRIGVAERTAWDGRIVQHLEMEKGAEWKQKLQDYQPEAVAVAFLHAYANPHHEEKMLQALQDRYPYTYISSAVNPEHREYERTSTTVMTAYIAPVVARYLRTLSQQIDQPLRIMSSAGGHISVERVLQQPVTMMLSGPAGGVVAGLELARDLGYERIVTFDMGGTSTDVAMLSGAVPLTRDAVFDNLPVRVPMVDIHTVGAGGGSIAVFDRGGSLRVGPQSAGAYPGPACYGRGGEHMTVTDANLLLGRLDPQNFLGGRMALDPAAARRAMQRLLDQGQQMGLAPFSMQQAAEGILEVAHATMARAIRRVTAMRGVDPARYALMSFGGAGGLHAAALAKNLGMSEVLVPADAGTLSAQGLARSQAFADRLRSVLLPLDQLSDETLCEHFSRLRAASGRQLIKEGYDAAAIFYEESLDLRYQGEAYEIMTGWQGTRAGTAEHFHHLHDQYYLHADHHTPIECVNVYVKATVKERQITLPQWRTSGSGQPFDWRPVVF